MKTVEIRQATASLADYARDVGTDLVVVTRGGRPLAALVPLDQTAWEDFVVSQSPQFLALIETARAGYAKDGGIPLEALEAEFDLGPRPAGKRHGTQRRPPTSPRRAR